MLSLFGLGEQCLGGADQLAAVQQKVQATAAELAPKGGGADRAEQKNPNLVGDAALLQVLGFANYLYPVGEGADRIGVNRRETGNHVFVRDTEVLQLVAGLVYALAHLIEHALIPYQAPLQMKRAKAVAKQGGLLGAFVPLE